ncbi:MAG: glucose 1-dehydrogenase [Acidimicrobiales bacterium]
MSPEEPSPPPSAAGLLTDLFGLDGKVAIVTGASSGLGDRFARTLRAAGAQVVVGARRHGRLVALADEIGVIPVACDVADASDRQRLVDTTLERFGQVDVLVNNAGISWVGPATDEPLDEWQRVIDVNLTGLFALTQLVGRHMLDRGDGSIINIASMLGTVASSPVNEASYVATKGAVVNLTRQLGAEWGRKGVRVNGIGPGWFRSELTTDMEDESSQAFIRRNCPMARMGEVHELDGALLYLAGNASTYVTGQTLLVDGGWTAR